MNDETQTKAITGQLITITEQLLEATKQLENITAKPVQISGIEKAANDATDKIGAGPSFSSRP